jgi:hypothetical protein
LVLIFGLSPALLCAPGRCSDDLKRIAAMAPLLWELPALSSFVVHSLVIHEGRPSIVIALADCAGFARRSAR